MAMEEYEKWEQTLRENAMKSGRHPAKGRVNGAPEELRARYLRAREIPGVKKFEPADMWMDTDKPLDALTEIFRKEILESSSTFMNSVHALVMRRVSKERDELLYSGEFAKLSEQDQTLWKDPQWWGETEAYAVLMDKCIDDVLMTYMMRRVDERYWG